MPASNARARTASASGGSSGRAPKAAEARELTNYRLTDRLAQEELATVYLATHTMLDRPVQVAVLRRTDWISTSRFQLAARLAARLSHPNILPIIDAGHDDKYGDYIVMPRLDGQTLEELLKHGPIEPLQALRIFAHVGAALDYLHEQHILHRDVRPANIFVTPQGTAYLMNFSLAAASDTPDLSSIEEADYLTPYSAPEQTLTVNDAAPAQDIYSLGAVLYHMLTGELPPVPGQPARVFGESNPGFAGVDRVLTRLLSEEPSQRFPNATMAAAALRQALRTQIDDATDDMHESRWEPVAEWLENPLETVVGPLLDQDFITRSRARADNLHRTGAIKRLMDRWGRAGLLRRPGLGQIIEPEQIVSYNLYFYELKAHYERRTTPEVREQMHTDGMLAPVPELALWDVPVPTLEPFGDAPPEQIVVPGSQHVVQCPECHGETQIPCRNCEGRGIVERTSRVKESDGTVRTDTFQENCPVCHGYGRQTCPRCEGNGHLLEEKIFTWARFGRLYLNEDDVGGLHKLTLETQAQEVFKGQIVPHEPRWHQVAPLHEMLEEAINGGGPDARLITAELTIRGVPVTEVDYQYRAKPRSLALIGFADEVRGDWSLIDLERLALYAAIAVMAVALLVLLISRF
ncbi:MAG TPA: protein kinase [Roseiflexaceae bacterium]|jgi:serine/threonine protein kinase|nr:protein kinase [Roseiflexaceae bacterium]